MKFATIYQLIVVLIIFQFKEIASSGKIYKTTFNKPYYIDYNEKYTWFEALHECSKLNMTLVTIESSLKSQEINKLINETAGKATSLWLGGFRTHYLDSHHYIWLATGQTFNYTLWSKNQPSFCKSDEYCVKLVFDTINNVEWKDSSCHRTNALICEYNNEVSRVLEQKLELLQKQREEEKQLKVELQEGMLKRENLKIQLKVQTGKLQKLEKLLQQLKVGETKQHKLFENRQNLQQELQKEQMQMGELLDQLKADDNGMTDILKISKSAV